MKAHGRSLAATARKPLILLFNSHSPSDRKMLSEWLASQSFSSYEASDALDAIDLISDFTTASVPEVVTIPRGVQDDISNVSEMIGSFMPADSDVSVFNYSQERNTGARSLCIEEVGHWVQRRRDRGTS